MIFRILMTFIILLAAVYVGVNLQHDPGYLLIAVNHWTIETTLWVAIPALLVFILLFHTLITLFYKITRIPANWHAWRLNRQAKKAQAKTRQGLIEFNEGHWELAKKHLINALPNADMPLLNYLTAARAAQEMGEHTLRDNYLRQAQKSMPEARIAVELTQAQLQLANHQWEQALATLKHLQDLSPHHPYVLKLLMQLHEETRDWPQLIALLPMLKRYQILANHTFKQKQQYCYLQALNDLIKQNQDIAIKEFIQTLPKELKYDVDITASYASYLLTQQQDNQAEILLHKCLQKQADEQLIVLYGQIKSDVADLGFIESLLKNHPHSAVLNLCLGQLCVSRQLWGKARAYFEESIKLHPSSKAYAELGKLFEQLHEGTAACDAYREGLFLKENQI
ncbi:MAG: heme biosynthesis HemY N-terminal domain-containing protein [Legionellaceae bacterium]|nr:heme biosynthesis HemY N-terminal domain-containing protein [Legionellaceae bacterium]